MSDGRGLRGLVLLIVGTGLLAPILAGLAETAAAAFGHLPALGFDGWSLTAWHALAAEPGLATSLRLTLVTGLGATALSVVLAMGAVAALAGRVPAARGMRALAPFLAVPHAAMAIGLAFLLAPSGWIARGLAPLMGWALPPDLASVNDPWGLALILGLLVKEVPFLMLVTWSALGQIDAGRQMAAGRALGYAPAAIWAKVLLPQLWPLVRLPVAVALAYALSVVDMAIILGPSNPPVLAVALTRWFFDPDPARILPAAAGALAQAGIVALGLALLWGAERLAHKLGRRWVRAGGRRAFGPGLAAVLVGGLLTLATLALLALAVWSLAWRWSFPQLLPESWSLKFWLASGRWGAALGMTLWLAMASAALSVALAILWLEAEDRGQRTRARWAEALIYLPLILPQIAFLYGLNVVALRAGLSGHPGAVIWAQAIFVFPYVMIALTAPWRALDPRLSRAAAALGAGPWRRLVRVKLPVLLRPILTAAAIGVAVSVAQYLPTLFLGAGRVATLTTEAVTLSSSSDRRVVAVYASLQALVPFVAYALAALLPAWVHRNRRDLAGAVPA